MRTYTGLYERIYPFDALEAAYCRARSGHRGTAEVLQFERDLEGELIQLSNELIWGEYRTGPYRTFHVHEPKRRLVAALPFRDRVLHHALVAQLEPIWEPRFIHHSYACRRGRGLHRGADTAQRWLREVQRRYGRAYVLKADVSKYFASIRHDVLLALIARHVRCRRTLDLCAHIVDTWRPGLPIGNLTSQLWANIYLHELDDLVKQRLGVRRYMRYMDDWLVVHHDKAYLHGLRRTLTEWLGDTLGLALNRKTQVYPVGGARGRALDFLGYRIWPTHRKLRKSSVRRMGRRMRWLARRYARGEIGRDAIDARVQSWLGHARHADSYRVRRDVLGTVTFKRNAS